MVPLQWGFCLLKRTTTSVWENVLEEIGEAIGPQRFQLWFHSLKLLELDDERAVVGTPNLFTRDWLEKRFKLVVEDAVARVVGRALAVEFRIDGSLYRRRQTEIAKDVDDPGAPREEIHAEERGKSRRTLSNFVVAACNELAYRAACRVVEDVGTFYNPLCIHGSSGLGKTHLLQGIAHALTARRGIRTRLVTGEEFTNQFVLSVRGGSRADFKKRFRGVDVLLVDGVDFLSSKQGTQEEFLHTVDALLNAGRQVIIASEAHPRELPEFHQGLVSRLAGGLVVRLDQPELATRVAILKAKAAERQLCLSPKIMEHIAASVTGNVRELEGALACVGNTCQEGVDTVELPMVQRAIAHLVPSSPEPLNMARIEKEVGRYFDVPVEKLHTRNRSRSVAYPRQICMYLGRELVGSSYQEIAEHFGSRNHTTAIGAWKNIQAKSEQGGDTRRHLMLLRARLKQSRI